MRQLARLYAPVLKRLDAEIKKAIEDLEANPKRVYQILRLRALRNFIASEVREFTQDAATVITAAQNTGLEAGLKHALLQIETAAATLGVSAGFRSPSIGALRELIGMLSNGSPLAKLLGKEAGRQAATVLITGLGKGKNPKAVARELHIRMQMPLRRAQMVSRTEMLRAYRSASIESYKKARVVSGWVWLSAASSRTCPVCWAMHGTFHALTERFASHVSCRCTQLPVVRGMMPPVAGSELFKQLSDQEQRDILGIQKHAAYRAGKIELQDLVQKGRNHDWGAFRRERSLKDALQIRFGR